MSEPILSDFDVSRVAAEPDVTATDGSGLALLARTDRASMAHGALPAGATSIAVVHQTVDELWFVVSGRAEVWRANDASARIVQVDAGASIAIPCGARFQYRTIGREPFCFIMTTIPAWPGDGEAVPVEGIWRR